MPHESVPVGSDVADNKVVVVPKVTYIEANGAQHVIDVPVGENAMRGLTSFVFPRSWRAIGR